MQINQKVEENNQIKEKLKLLKIQILKQMMKIKTQDAQIN